MNIIEHNHAEKTISERLKILAGHFPATRALRPLPRHARRRPTDRIAYAAALEVLG